jgi:DNA-binding winged helix-turn-helix (wHTH) protein/Tol biopolymer transport system component
MSLKPEQPLRVGEWCYLPAQDKLVKLDNQGQVIETAELDNLCQKALNYFLRHAGRLVTRDELLNDVWGVRDVSDGRISRVIRVLRVTLGDDTKEPRYIETIPKRGFRFVAEVTPLNGAVAVPEDIVEVTPAIVEPDVQAQPEVEQLIELVETTPSLLVEPATSNARWRWWYALPLLACVVLVYWWIRPSEPPIPYLRFTPISNLAGSERSVDVTADGRYLVYVHTPANSREEQLVLQQRDGSDRRVLLKVNGELLSGPQFSPDGLTIYYQRLTVGRSCEIRKLQLDAGQAKVLSDNLELKCNPKNFRARMSISPNGRYLVYPDYQDDSGNIALMLYSFNSGKPERLTVPPATSRGDIMASFASDSDMLAFIRDVGQTTGQIWIMSLTEREPRMMYQPQDRYPAGLAWYDKDSKILFPGAQHHIKQLDIHTGDVTTLAITDAPARDLVVLDAKTLVASSGENWQVHLIKSNNPLVNPANGLEEHSLSEALIELNPVPGGPEAVVNRRSGLQHVALRFADGNQQKLAEFASDFFITEFDYSSDGTSLLVGHANALWILQQGKEPIQVNKTDERVGGASWGGQGRYVYYFLSRQGHWLLHRFDMVTRETKFVSEQYDFYQESPSGNYRVWRDTRDGKFYFELKDRPAKVIQLADVSPDTATGFVSRENGFYFPKQNSGSYPSISRLNIQTGEIQDTGIRIWGAGRLYTVSADENYILRDAGRFGDVDIAYIQF